MKHAATLWRGLVALLACLMLASCSWQQPGKTAEESQTTTVKLAVPYDNPYSEAFLYDLVDRYGEEKSGGQVELEFFSYPDYEQTLEALATKGEQPDLMLVDNAYIPALSRQGTLAAIDVWLNETGLAAELRSDLLIAEEEQGIYGCPFLCWTYVLYYNQKELSREDCLQLSDWQKFLDKGRTYATTGKKIFSIAAADTEELCYQFQELLLAEQGNLHTLRVAENCGTLTGLETLVHNDVLPLECLDWNQADLTRRFAQGALVTMLNRSTQIPYLQSLSPSFAWEVLPFPLNSTQSHCMGIQSVVVSSEADPLAYDFLEWLMQSEQVRLVADNLNSIPVRTDVWQTRTPESGLKTAGDLSTQNLQYGGNFRSWPVISRAIRTGVRDILMQNKDSGSALLDMQYTIDRYYLW